MIKENYILTTGKKAYITPRTSFCGELGCGAVIVTSDNTVTGGGGTHDPNSESDPAAKQRNFYSPYSDNDNW